MGSEMCIRDSPECAQIIRVPRNKGKIEVRCPSCRKSFDAKS